MFIKVKVKDKELYLRIVMGELLWFFTLVYGYPTMFPNKKNKKKVEQGRAHRAKQKTPFGRKYHNLSHEEFFKWWNKERAEYDEKLYELLKTFKKRKFRRIRRNYKLFFKNFFWTFWIGVGKHNFNLNNYWKNYQISASIRKFIKKMAGHGSYQIYGFLVVMWFDVLLTDDEPLLEPIEWSMVQSWILFIFMFAWIGENLIASRYGSFTGKDKRLWAGWYKAFWIIECWYVFNYGFTMVVCIIPYYHELVYSLPLVHSWWHWYNRVFFYKFIAFLTLVLALGYWIQINYRWLHWKKVFFAIVLVNILWSYLIFTQSIIFIFGYFTDSMWYQKSYYLNYTRIGMGPWKWQIQATPKRDVLYHHPIKSTFWFKNDGPFGSGALLFHMLFLLTMFFVYIYWVALMRRVWATKEIPLTYTTYCVNTIKHFLYGFFGFYGLVFLSFWVSYLRLPAEFFFNLDSMSWLTNFYYIMRDYPSFLWTIIWNN